MTKRRSKKLDAADILPPETAAVPEAAAKAAAEKNPQDDMLRMPPLIDHAQKGGWARARHYIGVLAGSAFGWLADSPIGRGVPAAMSGLRQTSVSLVASLRRLVYRLSLLGLIGATVALAGFAVFQARDMTVPSFEMPDIQAPDLNALWQGASEGDEPAIASVADAAKTLPQNDAYIEDKNSAVPSLAVPALAEAPPSPDRALALPEEDSPQTPTILVPLRVAEIKQPPAKASPDRNPNRDPDRNPEAAQKDAQTITALTQRANMAELLVRLQSGWAFAALLESPDVQSALSARQLTSLALYANSGVPTQANLAAQAKGLWQTLQAPAAPPAPATLAADTMALASPIEQADPTTSSTNASIPSSAPPMPAFLQWLRARTGGLVAVQAAPPSLSSSSVAILEPASQIPMAMGEVTSGEDMRQIYQLILARDYDAAATKTRTAILRLDALSAPQTTASKIDSLQALYADLRALKEITPIVHDLRKTFLASRASAAAGEATR